VDEEDVASASGMYLANETAIEPYLVGRSHPYAKYCGLAVDRNTPRADPLFNFAPRC
jgi:hypothetical protein